MDIAQLQIHARDVETAIVEERNEELQQLERDIEGIAECMTNISLLLGQQGEKLGMSGFKTECRVAKRN